MPVGSGIAAQLGAAEETITNEVQTISGTAAATFTLSFDGAVTSSLTTTATAPQIQAALEALPNIGTGGVVCAGGALPTAVTVTFSGVLVAGRDVPLIVQASSTGLTITQTTAGKGYGDSNTPTRFWEFESEGLELEIDELAAFSRRAGVMYQRADRRRQGFRKAGGSIEMMVPTKSFGLWLKWLHGKAAVITTPAGGSTSRDQTFTLGDGWNIGATIQVGRPKVTSDASNVMPFTYLGCKVVGATFKLKAGEYLSCELEIDARDESESVGLAAASYVSAVNYLDWTGSTVTIGGAPVDAQEVELSIKRKANVDRFYHGSNLKRQPIVTDAWEVTAKVSTEYLDSVHYRRFSQESATLPSFTWAVDGATIEAITGGTAKYGLLWTIPNVVHRGSTPTTGDPDVVPQELELMAVYDGTNELVTTRYRSTDTTS